MILISLGPPTYTKIMSKLKFKFKFKKGDQVFELISDPDSGQFCIYEEVIEFVAPNNGYCRIKNGPKTPLPPETYSTSEEIVEQFKRWVKSRTAAKV